MTGRFVALEGVDGVGKTTLAGLVADLTYEQWLAAPDREPAGVVFVPRRARSGTSPFAARLMEHLAQMLWHSGDSRDLEAAFWVTLQASWFTAHSTCVIGPVLDSGHDVVVDGWYYKFWSKLLGQGFRREDLETVFASAREPDHVVLLDADVATVFDRRTDFRPTELGLHAGYGGLDRASFVDYQSRGLGVLKEMARERGWTTVAVAADETVPDTAESTRSAVRAALHRHG
ncbi:dTMP kinase [Saccharothrix saharensis]|uniref:dTMP kinase n=1 Tax=Saccharothrix saharensis TaxID=571190 RepID=UPI0036827DD0